MGNTGWEQANGSNGRKSGRKKRIPGATDGNIQHDSAFIGFKKPPASAWCGEGPRCMGSSAFGPTSAIEG